MRSSQRFTTPPWTSSRRVARCASAFHYHGNCPSAPDYVTSSTSSPPVFAVREANRRFLSFEYEEGVCWFDEPLHAPAYLAAGTLLDTDEDGGGYDSDGSDDCDWTDYH